MHLEVSSDQDFITHSGDIKQQWKHYNGDYLNDSVIFGQVTNKADSTSILTTRNPRIKSLQEKL